MTIEVKECFDELAVLIPMGVELIVIVTLALLAHYYWHKARTRSRNTTLEKYPVEGERDAGAASSRKDLIGDQRTALIAEDQTLRLQNEVENERTTHEAEVKNLESKNKNLQEKLDIALQAKHDEVTRLQNKVEDERTTHEAEVKNLESKNKTLQQKLDIALQAKDDEVTRSNSCQFEVERLTNKCKTLQEVKDNALSINCRMKSQAQAQMQARIALEESLQEQIVRVSKEKEEALLRLSENMAAQLTDRNPKVTDLSDENRPIKLSERLTELYDNQYTDAQEILTDMSKVSYSEEELTKKTAQFLLNIIKSTFAVCQDSAEKQLTMLKYVFTNPAAETDSSPGAEQSGVVTELPKTIMKAIKDKRKTVKPDVSILRKKIIVLVKQESEPSFAETIEHEAAQKYLDESIEICWLMSVQDPPMYLEFKEHNFDRLRRFIQSGSELEFHVWPSLYLYKDGPLMVKGVAQFCEHSNWQTFE